MNAVLMMFGLIMIAIVVGYGLFCLTGKPWFSGIIGYLLVGFLGVALPLASAIPATNIFGIMFLTVAWLPWVGQNVFGYNLLDLMSVEFMSMMFTF